MCSPLANVKLGNSGRTVGSLIPKSTIPSVDPVSPTEAKAPVTPAASIDNSTTGSPTSGPLRKVARRTQLGIKSSGGSGLGIPL